MVRRKSILTGLAVISLLGLSACSPDTISYSILENNKTLYITSNAKSCYYRQEDSKCYVSNYTINEYFDGTVYYSFSNNQKNLAVKIKGDVSYTFYHYSIDFWCIL